MRTAGRNVPDSWRGASRHPGAQWRIGRPVVDRPEDGAATALREVTARVPVPFRQSQRLSPMVSRWSHSPARRAAPGFHRRLPRKPRQTAQEREAFRMQREPHPVPERQHGGRAGGPVSRPLRPVSAWTLTARPVRTAALRGTAAKAPMPPAPGLAFALYLSAERLDPPRAVMSAQRPAQCMNGRHRLERRRRRVQARAAADGRSRRSEGPRPSGGHHRLHPALATPGRPATALGVAQRHELRAVTRFTCSAPSGRAQSRQHASARTCSRRSTSGGLAQHRKGSTEFPDVVVVPDQVIWMVMNTVFMAGRGSRRRRGPPAPQHRRLPP